MTTRLDEAQSIILAMGWVNDLQHQVGVVAWGIKEGSRADNNMLDTEEGGEAGETDFNSVGVKNYPTLAEGDDAVRHTLDNGRYPLILAWGKDPNGQAMQLASNPEMDVWGTGNFESIVTDVLANPDTYFNQTVVASSFTPPPAPVAPAPEVPIVLDWDLDGDNIADIAVWPQTGGIVLLTTKGAIFNDDSPYFGGANQGAETYFVGRTAASLTLTGPAGAPTGYRITDTAGENYQYPVS